MIRVRLAVLPSYLVGNVGRQNHAKDVKLSDAAAIPLCYFL
jgi:hypothetical protein